MVNEAITEIINSNIIGQYWLRDKELGWRALTYDPEYNPAIGFVDQMFDDMQDKLRFLLEKAEKDEGLGSQTALRDILTDLRHIAFEDGQVQ